MGHGISPRRPPVRPSPAAAISHLLFLRPPPPSLISSSSSLIAPLPPPSLFVLQIWLELPPPLWQGQSAQARVARGGAGGGLHRQLHECPRPISVTAHILPATVRGPPYIWRRIKPLDRVLAEVKGWRA
ncbi:hypothetical protein GQ55_9G249100 [Panicum hallii var. hallii]|uniref:Uncharacterized protein n=1 Tax=Panicum hallii var. hallii TaxID=1504633 RepID=A0A2T7C725_9POAL|nr:hypothetical protein GQ55_9G249100 [Panicum hallii var. hallii]PUZ39034.1 hypothetical protein GQ55_9G249100 [Panicum hallii var. hallii]